MNGDPLLHGHDRSIPSQVFELCCHATWWLQAIATNLKCISLRNHLRLHFPFFSLFSLFLCLRSWCILSDNHSVVPAAGLKPQPSHTWPIHYAILHPAHPCFRIAQLVILPVRGGPHRDSDHHEPPCGRWTSARPPSSSNPCSIMQNVAHNIWSGSTAFSSVFRPMVLQSSSSNLAVSLISQLCCTGLLRLAHRLSSYWRIFHSSRPASWHLA